MRNYIKKKKKIEKKRMDLNNSRNRKRNHQSGGNPFLGCDQIDLLSK
jgi:hypothetical protein